MARAALTKPTDLQTPPRDNTRVLRPGTGTLHPAEDDIVKVSYVVWDLDGKVVDKIDAPSWTVVDLKETTPEWRADIVKMVAGEQRRTWMPKIGTVTDTELVEIFKRPAAPPDVAAPPADAIRTSSGLAYKILRQGPGRVHPKPGDRVLIGYTGWTSEGKIYDSSILRGAPALDLPVNGGIKGWVEAVQLMTSGAKMRVWMPKELAFAGDPTRPQTMMVWDFELFTVSSEIMPKRGKPRSRPTLPPEVH